MTLALTHDEAVRLLIECDIAMPEWEQPAEMLAVVDPLTLEICSIGSEKTPSSETIAGCVFLNNFQENLFEEICGKTAPDWAQGVVLAAECLDFPPGTALELKEMTTPTDWDNPQELKIFTILMRNKTAARIEKIRGEDKYLVHSPNTLENEYSIDLLLRVLNLSTGKPLIPITELVGRLWLLHKIEELEKGQVGEFTPGELLPSSWKELLLAAREGKVGGVSITEAKWMDEGIFSKRILAGVASKKVSLDTLAALVGERETEKIFYQGMEKGLL